MSCETLAQSLVRMEVGMGALPEGFCPENMQELANAIATRLIVTPNQAFSSFAIGSVAPTSNVGPWFKDCATWFVWDDGLAMYIPMTKEGFNTQQYFSASTVFQVPAFIYKIKVTAFGAGGGGADSTAGINNAGGAGGGFGVKIQNVSPGENIVLVIGAGGARGTPIAAAGGNPTVADDGGVFMTCNGGTGGGAGGGGNQSIGGTSVGGDVNIQGGAGAAAFGGAGAGGDAGGWGGAGGAIGEVVAQRSGIAPGGGGCGGIAGIASLLGGNGADGGVLIEY